MIFAMAACGKDAAPETTDTETSEVTEEASDALAGTTYQLSAISYEGEDGNMVDGTVDADHPDIIVFGTDGTYSETFYEPDYENDDPDTLLERKVDGTYTIDGSTVTLSTRVVEPTSADEELPEGSMPITEEEAKAMTPTITLEGSDLVFTTEHFEHANDNGSTMVITATKNVFTKK